VVSSKPGRYSLPPPKQGTSKYRIQLTQESSLAMPSSETIYALYMY
jgi:hypothetical protein